MWYDSKNEYNFGFLMYSYSLMGHRCDNPAVYNAVKTGKKEKKKKILKQV